MWQLLVFAALQKPVLGFGYGAYWGTGEIPDILNIKYSFMQFLNQAHNGYLDVILQLGITGFITLIAFFMFSVKKFHLNPTLIPIFSLVTLFIQNCTESTVLVDQNFLWVFFLINFSAVNIFYDKNINPSYSC
ncbi:O-antigen ligase family protein [Endozoicomonas sp. GU-1]|uniref:O-antigen ligase family protein n=1 Tax=Endozoicomonas sp. GU-1 TaxID=3009078 RepID=UPI003FA49765